MDARLRVTRRLTSLWPTAILSLSLLALAGCNRGTEPPPPPDDNRPIPKPALAGGDNPFAGVTPMEQRVAVLGLLNKRNGLVRDITLKPGESIRIGRAVVRLRACERTAQWEAPQETGAFVQLIVLEHSNNQWTRIFSGWLFKERPERNIIQHPIYDVFVRSCTMTWPGEVAIDPDEDAAASSPRAAPPSDPSNAPQEPTVPPPSAAPDAPPPVPPTAAPAPPTAG